MISQQSLSLEVNETPKLPTRLQHIAKQTTSSQAASKMKLESGIGEIRKVQLRKQMSMDLGKERPTNDRGQRGYLMKQMSMDPNVLLRRQQKMFQVNLIKQMSVQSMPDTPRVVRKALDKRLKKEQGMTILVSVPCKCE